MDKTGFLADLRRSGERVLVLLCVAALGFGGAPSHAEAMPQVPYPSGSTIGVIGDEMIVNGFVSRVREIRWPGHGREELINFYRGKLFTRSGAKSIVLGQNEIVSGFLGRTYVTVVAHNGPGGVGFGKLMQADLSRAVQTDWQSAMPAGSKMLTQVDSQDGGRISSIVMYANAQSIDANTDFAVKRLQSTQRLSVSVDQRSDVDGQPGRVVVLSNGMGGETVVTAVTKKGMQVVTVQSMNALEKIKGTVQ